MHRIIRSNVVFNLSLHTLFISIPSGSQTPARSENWYYKIAPDAFQAFYSCARNKLAPDYPENAADYLSLVKGKKNRKRLANAIKHLSGEEAQECNQLYLEMCHEVAERSADMFNDSLTQSLNGPAKIAVIEQVIRNLFRIGDTSYILCGLDKNQEFAVKIPDLTTWKREWQFRFRKVSIIEIFCRFSAKILTQNLRGLRCHWQSAVCRIETTCKGTLRRSIKFSGKF